MNERMLAEQYIRRRDKPIGISPDTDINKKEIGDVWDYAKGFGTAFADEAWNAAVGLPMLPLFMKELTGEVLIKAPVAKALAKTGKVLYLHEMMMNPRTIFDTQKKINTDFHKAISGLDLEHIDDQHMPIISAISKEYYNRYGTTEGLKSIIKDPEQMVLFISDVAPALGKIAKAGKMGKHSAKFATLFDVVDASNIPGATIGGGFKAVGKMLPPAKKPATIREQFGIDAEGKPLLTDITAAEAAEKYGAGEQATIMSVLSDSDRLASLESAIGFEDQLPEGFDPELYTADTVSGVMQRIALTKHVGDQKINEALRGMADKAGIPHTHLTDPHTASKHIIDGVLKQWEQGDLTKRAELAKYVRDMQGEVRNNYESGVLLKDAVKKQYDLKDKEFEEAYNQNKELMDAEINLDDTETPDKGTPPQNTPPADNTPDPTDTPEPTPEPTPKADVEPAAEPTPKPEDTPPPKEVTVTIGETQMIKGNWGGKYEGKFGVTDIDNLIFSHNIDGTKNPTFPERLQPRDRTDYTSQVQIRRIAKEFDPELALDKSSTMNDGAPLTIPAEKVYTPEEIQAHLKKGEDVRGKYVVLSGNARTSAYKTATTQYPDRAENYRNQLGEKSLEYGLTPEDIQQAGENPFLFREVLGDMDTETLISFAEEANEPVGKAMRVSEHAEIDANKVDADLLSHLEPVEATTLRHALKNPANADLVKAFINRIEPDKRSAFYDQSGRNVSDAGYQRIENAITAYVLDGEYSKPLIETFVDASEPGMVNTERAVQSAMLDLAELKGMLESGDISKDYEITENLAFAIGKVDALIKRKKNKEEDVIGMELAQPMLLSDPLEAESRHLYRIVETSRNNPGALREFLQKYVSEVKALGSDKQTSLVPVDKATKEQILRNILGDNFDQIPTKQISLFASGGSDLEPNIAAILPTTNAKLKELIQQQGHTRRMIKNPDLQAVSRIISELFSSETADEIDMATQLSGKGLTVGDFVRLRTNFRKSVDVEVNKGAITPVGAGELKNVFYHTLSEDLDTLVTRMVEQGTISEEAANHFRITNAKYRSQMELQDTEIAKWVQKVEEYPERIVPSILKMNPKRLETFKRLTGADGYAEQQANIMNYILEQSRDKEGNITSKGIRDQIGKMQVALDDLLGKDNANKLRELIQEVDRVEAIPAMRETKAAKFLLKNAEQPSNLFYELTKAKSIFNKQELDNLKTIMGEQRWEQMKAGLLGHIFQQAAVTSDKNLNPAGLKNVLGLNPKRRSGMLKRDKNRLVHIYGEEVARELVEQANFWERHHRLSGWNKNSNTAFHQNARKFLAGATAASLMQDIAYWINIRRINVESLNAIDYASLTLLIGSFGGPYLWKQFMKSEPGRKYMMDGVGIRIPGTTAHITAESLDRAADFMINNKVVIGYAAHKTQQTREEAERRRNARKNQSRLGGYYERLLVE